MQKKFEKQNKQKNVFFTLFKNKKIFFNPFLFKTNNERFLLFGVYRCVRAYVRECVRARVCVCYV